MGEVYFYHLTRSTLEAALALLLPRSLERGWRVAVRGTDPARLDRLDQQLWQGADDDFLPHGCAGGPHDDLQPVLLTTAPPPPGFACLMAIEGAEVTTADATGPERTCILFDGTDPGAVEAAREHWKRLTSEGLPARYWSEDGGRWQMKAESAGKAPG